MQEGLFETMKVEMPQQPVDIRQEQAEKKAIDIMASELSHYFSSKKDRTEWIKYRLFVFGWYIDSDGQMIGRRDK